MPVVATGAGLLAPLGFSIDVGRSLDDGADGEEPETGLGLLGTTDPVVEPCLSPTEGFEKVAGVERVPKPLSLILPPPGYEAAPTLEDGAVYEPVPLDNIVPGEVPMLDG